MDNSYIMITGPAASGKSTLCKNICIELPAFFYKPANAYFELAQKYNIAKDRVFYDVNPHEVSTYFCHICKMHDIVVGDQHLAIQHKKDSAIALNKLLETDPNEPYVSAIDYSLFEKMNEASIKMLIIYLNATKETLFERAYKRSIETGLVLRNSNLDQVKDEMLAEEYYFNELINKMKLPNLIIKTDDYNEKEICSYAKRRILEYKKNGGRL